MQAFKCRANTSPVQSTAPNKALHLTAFPLAPTSPAPSRQVSLGVRWQY